MVSRSFKKRFARLNITRKWVLAGALLTAASTLMPWYEDLDAFGAGAKYFGVTGPLYLVGLLVLGASLGVAVSIAAPLFGRSLPKLPFREGALFALLGLHNLMMLLIANSVFFHPAFGVNITLKGTRFGMAFAFIGVLVMIGSSYRLYRGQRKPVRASEPVTMEPLIKMEPRRSEPSPRPASVESVRQETNRRMTDDAQVASDSAPQPIQMDL